MRAWEIEWVNADGSSTLWVVAIKRKKKKKDYSQSGSSCNIFTLTKQCGSLCNDQQAGAHPLLGLSANCSLIPLFSGITWGQSFGRQWCQAGTCQMTVRSVSISSLTSTHSTCTHSHACSGTRPKQAEAPLRCTSHMLKSFPVLPLFVQRWARDGRADGPRPQQRLQLSHHCWHFLPPPVHLNFAGHHQLCSGLAAKCEQTGIFI